jgi:hypothetical protein
MISTRMAPRIEPMMPTVWNLCGAIADPVPTWHEQAGDRARDEPDNQQDDDECNHGLLATTFLALQRRAPPVAAR